MGAAIVASRFVLAEVQPLTLALLRYAIGVLCIAPILLAGWRGFSKELPKGGVPARDLLAMAALGIAQFALLIALFNWGLKTVGAAQAAMIFSLFPLLTMLLTATTRQESISPCAFAGVVISVCGVGFAMVPKLAASQAGHWWGEVAVLASTFIGALCAVLSKPYLNRYPSVPVSAYAMFAAAIFLAFAALWEAWPQRVPQLGASAWAAVGFVGFASGIGYVAWLYALKYESATRVTVFVALNPMAAAFLGWVFLGETLHSATYGGLLLVFAGLWLATRPSGVTENRQQALR